MAEGHHDHGGVHLDPEHWRTTAAHSELEGEVLLAFVTDSAAWLAQLRGSAPPVRRIVDIGSGPGVGTCELARLFPEAHVTAVDSSPAVLDRARRRARTHGLGARIDFRLAELPNGLDGLEPADLIWASMSLHHVGDEIESLRALRNLLDPHGLVAVAERAEPMRFLPDDLDVGRPGLADRLERAESAWFSEMREGLPGSVPSSELGSMLTAAGMEVVGSRLARERLDPPLSEDARRLLLGHLCHRRGHVDGGLDDDDLRTLDVLADADDPRGVMNRSDVFLEASRHVVIGRRPSEVQACSEHDRSRH